MPGALWLPISRNFTNRRRDRTRALVLHVADSEAASLRGWFNNPAAGASSHLYVRRDGTIEQYLDLDVISWANGQGNSSTVTVETQGRGRGEWTAAQVDALARIARFVHERYGVPLRLMPDSRPESSGVGYHRLGVDPWRVSGGEKWSKHRGKICPGPDRIPQIPTIIARARGGAAAQEEDDLASPETIEKIAQRTRDLILGDRHPKRPNDDMRGLQVATYEAVAELPSVREFWTHKHPSRPSTDMRGYMVSTYELLAKTEAKVEGLVEIVRALATGSDLDVEALLDGVEKRAEQGVRNVVGERLVVRLEAEGDEDG